MMENKAKNPLADFEELVVTNHAREKYRVRVDPAADDAAIDARIARAVAAARFCRSHYLGGDRYLGNWLVFAAKRDGGKLVITTVFGMRRYYEWERRSNARTARKVLQLWG